MQPVLCSHVTITYKTPKGNVRKKEFNKESDISIKGELISQIRCNLPCQITELIDYYDSCRVGLEWRCKKQHLSEGPYEGGSEEEASFIYLLNENWSRIQQPITPGGS